jgi:peptidoglycan/xylan/chitin deacetylase (PgdA/CDA1 family)
LLIDGLEVIARGHRADPRVPCPAPEHALGEPAEQRAAASLVFVVWAAGLEIGHGRDPLPLFESLAGLRAPGLQPEDLKWSLLYSLLLPSGRNLSDWPTFWPSIESDLRRFLEALEAHSGARDLAARSLRILSDLILASLPQRPLTVGSIYALEMDVGMPLPTLEPGASIDRARIVVVRGQRKLGSLDLPVFDGSLPAEVIADAIASDFGWTILGEFFHPTAIPEVATQLMAQSGWTQFLQELFDKPQWPADKFYSLDGDPGDTAICTDDDGWIRAELSGDIPSVQTTREELHVVPTIGGVALGAFAMPCNARLVTSQALRAAIVLECGVELLVASVREGVLGQPFAGSPLRTRLANAAAKRALQPANPVTRIGRRELGRIDTILSRRAALPGKVWPEIAEAARALCEPIDIVQPLGHCAYTPDFIHPDLGGKNDASAPDAIRHNSRDYGRDHFESLFAEGADPWDYDNDYEATKYQQTLSLVPDGVHAALELACAEGHFTERLATRVEQLVAADISTIALDRARARCATHTNVSFMPIDLVADAMPGRFDLIVCSEVLYYAGGREDLARVATKLADALTPGGRILLAHANVLADEPDRTGFSWALPYGAKAIEDAFAAVPQLQLEREIRTPLYRIQLFCNVEDVTLQAIVTNLGSTGTLPADVAAHVREGGGIPPAPVANEFSTERLPILAYHRIAPTGSAALAPYRIAPEAFEAQLRYLKDAGYRSVGLEEWRAAMVKHAPLAGRCVMFTFDDGTCDFSEFAWPLLKKYGFGATLFVVAGEVGDQNRWDHAYGEDIALLNWDELRALSADGLEIGAHSHSHHHLTALSPEELVRDSLLTRRILIERLGYPIRSMAYPYGDHDRVVRHLVGAAGFSFGLTCEEGRCGLWDNAMQLKRLTILGSDDFASFVRMLSHHV